MKKFINETKDITAELLDGFAKAYSEEVEIVDENIVASKIKKPKDKVAIITLGGSGHEPALSGFVGQGMLDCSVVGDIFAAPGAQRVLKALQLFKRDAGILLVTLNHSGDVMSSKMAIQLAERMGIKAKMLLTHDDISAGTDIPDEDRRGLAGCIPLYKILGAASEQGKTLEELLEIGTRYNENVATLAVASGKCTHPQNGVVISDLPEGEIEIGMGQHGEGGGGRQALISADDTAEKMITELLKKIKLEKGDTAMLIINGVGGTTYMEMNIVFRKAYDILVSKGICVAVSRIGEFLTVQEQSGFQMILAKLDNDHVDYMNNYMSNSPYWKTIGK